MNEHEIAGWFLILGLFVPRLTLLIAWLGNAVPFNTVPLVGDIVLTILFPRILILIYIYGCMGLCAWFWVHLVVGVLVFLSGAIYNSPRTTTSR